jgi:hypothetical protein
MNLVGGSILCLLLLASCSNDGARLVNPASVGGEAIDTATLTGAMRVSSGTVGAVTTASRTSRWISVEYGGVVSNGRFTVWFPPRSVSKITFVTIKMARTGGMMECEIFPSDLVLNAPATLLVDLRGIQSASTAPDTIFWFDSQRQTWVDVGTVGESSRGPMLETRIGRLGRYMAGRTGQ